MIFYLGRALPWEPGIKGYSISKITPFSFFCYLCEVVVLTGKGEKDQPKPSKTFVGK